MPREYETFIPTFVPMRKSLCAITVATALFAGAPAAFSQQPLSIEQAVTIGLEQNRDIKIAVLHAESVGEARVRETEANRLPSLKLFASYTRLSDIGENAIPVPIPGVAPFAIQTYLPDNYTVKLTLAQPLFTGFRLQNAQSAAEHSSAAAQQDVRTERRGAVFTIKQQYWSLFKMQRTLIALDTEWQEAQSHLQDVKNKYAQGAALQNDVLKTQVQVSNIDLMRIETEKNIQTAEAALMNTIGLPLDTKTTLTSAPADTEQPAQTLEENITAAQKNRSEIKALDERIAAGEASVGIARAGYFPQISLAADLIYQNPNQRFFPVQNAFKTTWDAGVNLSWDLWTWNAPGDQAQQAEYSLQEMQESKKKLEAALALEVTQDYLARQTSAEQIRTARLAVQQANENLRVVQLQYAQGMANNTDVLDAETLAMQAQVHYASAAADASIAAARLEQALGKERQ